MKKPAALLLATALSLSMLCGCGSATPEYHKNAKLDTADNITLVIAGRIRDFKAMDIITQKFSKIYPNCRVEYEYLQDFDKTLPKRIYSKDDRVDMFITANIQEGSANMEYALDILEYSGQLPLSDTFSGLVDNFKYVENEKQTHLYSVPMGGEMRGLYVNKTLLSKLNIAVPENLSQLLSACERLRNAGYVPLQDNPGCFGQRLMFPYIAHLIADSDEPDTVRRLFAECDKDAAEILRAPLELIYDLAAENFYNYKYVEVECKRFLDLSDEGMARSFLSISDENGVYEKEDDLGAVPFMTSADSLLPVIDKVKEDYHSLIEYEFILAPVSDSGGYAYMSPCNGLAVNKSSYHLDWCLEFMNFFFTAENNREFAQIYNITPNTADALDIISRKYNIPVDEINQPADVTFDYNFYNLIIPVLTNTAKANNPKYMLADGSGGYKMYPFETYMDSLKEAFAQQRAGKGE